MLPTIFQVETVNRISSSEPTPIPRVGRGPLWAVDLCGSQTVPYVSAFVKLFLSWRWNQQYPGIYDYLLKYTYTHISAMVVAHIMTHREKNGI